MIGYLKGEVIFAQNQKIIVNVGNVGYEVNIGSELFTLNSEVELFTYSHIKEDEFSLWGVKEAKQLKMLKLLVSISGVGPRTALNLITLLTLNGIIGAIQSNNSKSLKITGVGMKTAEKIILELRDKLDGFEYTGDDAVLMQNNSRVEDEVSEALMSLGYKDYDISKSLEKIISQNIEYSNLTSEEKIKLLLRNI